jgi:toxin ParE1/3/4
MILREVVFSPGARRDLENLADWLTDVAGERIALGYVKRIEQFCLGFDFASERGHRRDDLRPGLRIAGFKKRVTVAFTVTETTVTFLRVFYGGQNWEDEF